ALHHPLVIVDLADIPAAVVVEDDHDEIALFQQVLQLHEALDSSPRAVSAKQALFARDATRHEGGILVGHLFEDVDDAHVIVLRYEILPDALRYIRVHFIHIDLAGPEIFGQQRPIRVHGPDLDGGILFLEVHGCSGDGAAGTRGDNQVRHFAVGLLPDLGPRSFIVREPVGEVIVLIGVKGVRDLPGQAPGDGIVGARVAGFDIRGTNDYFGAEGFEDVDLFLRLLVCRGEDAFISLDDRGEGKAHAGVPRSAFDDRAAGFELS